MEEIKIIWCYWCARRDSARAYHEEGKCPLDGDAMKIPEKEPKS